MRFVHNPRLRAWLAAHPVMRAIQRFIAVPLVKFYYWLRDPERAALAHSAPVAPPPRRPRRLPGRLWAITSYYNPAGYTSRKRNYDQFRAALRQQGVPLLAVEAAMGNGFELHADDADLLIQGKGGAVLWQKERLLNIALANLPDDCDKVVWMDNDVLLTPGDWANKTAALLEEYLVVQPFTTYTRMHTGKGPAAEHLNQLPVGREEGQRYHSMAWGVAHKGYPAVPSYKERGHTGFAWAARRDIFDGLGFFDGAITGGGDLLIALALYSGAEHIPFSQLPPGMGRALREWADAIHARVERSIGYTEASLFHQWHGSTVDRLYGHRNQILVESDYDPARDLRVNEFGAFEWATDKPALQRWCRDYFNQRRED
ncbi:MAG: hypothetical protein EPO32_10095 [Anaerolineae bacterium]|nr:MAG: hypothetical protein EPO32_10095 [Anaerolineae bacterium]